MKINFCLLFKLNFSKNKEGYCTHPGVSIGVCCVGFMFRFFGTLAFFNNYSKELNETSHKCLLSHTDLFQTSCLTLPCILTELLAFLDLEIMLKVYGKLYFYVSKSY